MNLEIKYIVVHVLSVTHRQWFIFVCVRLSWQDDNERVFAFSSIINFVGSYSTPKFPSKFLSLNLHSYSCCGHFRSWTTNRQLIFILEKSIYILLICISRLIPVSRSKQLRVTFNHFERYRSFLWASVTHSKSKSEEMRTKKIIITEKTSSWSVNPSTMTACSVVCWLR